MKELIEAVVKSIAEGARTYVRDSSSKLDDFLLPLIDTIEKFVLEKLLTGKAGDRLVADVSKQMERQGMVPPK